MGGSRRSEARRREPERAVRRTEAKRSPQQPDLPEGTEGGARPMQRERPPATTEALPAPPAVKR
jgi:hypothetical protein